jgi:hypothetical protein
MAQNYRILHRVVQRLSEVNFNMLHLPYLKASSNKLAIQIEIVGV